MGGWHLRSNRAPRTARLGEVQYEKRSFAVDVLECPRCGGRRTLIAVITDPAAIVAFLESLDVPSRAPPVAPARQEDGQDGETDPSGAEVG